LLAEKEEKGEATGTEDGWLRGSGWTVWSREKGEERGGSCGGGWCGGEQRARLLRGKDDDRRGYAFCGEWCFRLRKKRGSAGLGQAVWKRKGDEGWAAGMVGWATAG
jgi:hypothetical protein